MQLSQSSVQEIHCSLLLACYSKYSSGNYISDKSKAKMALMENSLFYNKLNF